MSAAPLPWSTLLAVAAELAMCANRLECTCLKHDLPWTRLKKDEPERICHRCRTLELYKRVLADLTIRAQGDPSVLEEAFAKEPERSLIDAALRRLSNEPAL